MSNERDKTPKTADKVLKQLFPSESVLVEPSSTWEMLSFEQNPVNEGLRRLSLDHAAFYRGFINKLVSGSDTSDEGLADLFESLPKVARKYYRKACQDIRSELDLNHQWILSVTKSLSDQEANVLFTILTRKMSSDDKRDAILCIAQNINNLRFFEPNLGLAVIAASDGSYDALREKKIVPERSVGVFHERYEDPSFIVYDSTGPEAQNRLVHEASHFVFDVLETNNDLPRASEKIKNLETPFRRFRNELSAYLVSDMEARGRPAWHFIYEDIAEEGIAWTETAQTFVEKCLSTAGERGIDPGIYLYGAMRARNFSELMAVFSKVTKWIV